MRTKEFTKIWYHLLKSRLYMPSHFKVCFNDILRVRSNLKDDFINRLKNAMNWLRYAQDVNEDGGVSAAYSFARGWQPSYPETTGYIIPTFINYYHFTSNKEYLQRAIKMADWLVSIQMESGAFKGGFDDAEVNPIVFNTGQIVLGLVSIYKETQNEKYKDAAVKAGNWLVKVQDDNGAWSNYTYNNIAHAYHTRVAWALLELNKIESGPYRKSAINNINWALSNQLSNGWFKNNAFYSNKSPFVHTIAYTLRGILESALLLDNSEWIERVKRPAEVLLRKFELKGQLVGTYNYKWKSNKKYSCLTGDAQMSIIWLRLFQITGDGRYLNVALKINDYIKCTQDIRSKNKGIRGGIKGSHPVWGEYGRFEYLSWATKFFVDAIMLQEDIMSDLGENL